MPLSNLNHIDNLLRHKEKVKEAAIFLAKELLFKEDRVEFARELIARGYAHDNSKFENEIEWNSLHCGADIAKGLLDTGIKCHQSINRHHPEFWKGFENMDEISVAEMACDFLARSQEFGSGLREWIESTAIEKYKINKDCIQYKWLMNFVGLLIQDYFRRD